MTREEAIIILQKWVRGHLQRLRFKRQQDNFRYMRKLRRILALRFYKLKARFI